MNPKPRPYHILYIGPQALWESWILTWRNIPQVLEIKRDFLRVEVELSKQWLDFSPRSIRFWFTSDLHHGVSLLQKLFFFRIFLDFRKIECNTQTCSILDQHNDSLLSQLNYNDFMDLVPKAFLDFAPSVKNKIVSIDSKLSQESSSENLIITKDKSDQYIRLFLVKQIQKDQSLGSRQTGLCVSGGSLEGYLNGLALLKTIEQEGKIPLFETYDNFGGVSSGSILSSLLFHKMKPIDLENHILGYRSPLPDFRIQDLFQPQKKIEFRVLRQLVQDPWKLLSDLFPYQGIFSMDPLFLLFKKTFERDNHIQHFQSVSKELQVGFFNLKTQKLVVYSNKNTRGMSLADALCASCSVPILFKPYKHKGERYLDGMLITNSLLSVMGRKSSFLTWIDVLPQHILLLKAHESLTASTVLKSFMFLLRSRDEYEMKYYLQQPEANLVVFRNPQETFRSAYTFPLKSETQKEIYYDTIIQAEKRYQYFWSYYNDFLAESKMYKEEEKVCC